MSWKLKHAVYSLWHDCLVHPCCGVMWSLRGWLPRIGAIADRLHNWDATRGLP